MIVRYVVLTNVILFFSRANILTLVVIVRLIFVLEVMYVQYVDWVKYSNLAINDSIIVENEIKET